MIDKLLILLYMAYLFFVPEGIKFGFFSYSKILLIFTLGILIYNLFKKGFKNILCILKDSKNILYPLIFFMCVVAFSNANNLIKGSAFLMTNFYEVLRVILYIGIFIIYSIYYKDYKKYIIKIVLIFVSINCVVGATQFYNFFNINEMYIRFFAPTQYETLVGGYAYPRIVSFTGNPNVYGFILALISVFILNLIMKNKKNITLYILFILVKLNLYMTMSRSSFICMILGELIFIVIYYFRKKQFKNLLKQLLLIIIFEMTFLIITPNNITWRIKSLININNINSWEIRQNRNDNFFNKIIDNGKSKTDILETPGDNNKPKTDILKTPGNNENGSGNLNYSRWFIGYGSDKLNNSKYYDNEWILIFHRYGLFGIVSILCIFIMPLMFYKKFSINKYSLIFALLIISVVYMYPAGLIHSYKIFPILLMIYAYLYTTEPKDNKNILLIATYFPPYGGVGVMRITKFAKYLKQKGWNPIVVTSTIDYCTNYDEGLLKDVDDLKIYRLDFLIKNNNIGKYYYKSLRKNLSSIIEKEDPKCAFITGGPFYPFKIGSVLNNYFLIPYILDFRDPWTMQVRNVNGLKKILIDVRNNINEFFSILYSKAIITVNNTLTDQYTSKYPIFKNKMYVVGNGYDKDDFDKLNSKKFNEYTILYSGKFEVSAGFRDPTAFFKALRKINDSNKTVKFVHIGNIEDRVVDIAKKIRVLQYCDFKGYMSYFDTISYCMGADLLLIISGKEKSEQTGKIYDYIGCDKNILAITDNSNELYKICTDLDNCFVSKPDDVNNIEKCILDSIDNNNMKDNKSRSYLKYDRNYLTDELIEIINQVKERN